MAKFDRQQACYNRYIALYYQHLGTIANFDDIRQDDYLDWNEWLDHRANALSDTKFTLLDHTDKTYTIGAIYTVDTGRHLQSIFIVVSPRGVHEWYIDYNWVTEHDCVTPVYLGPVPSHRKYHHLTTMTAPFLTEEGIDNLQ